VLDSVGSADLVLLAPSNPVVSIGTILSVPGIREALDSGPAPVVGVSPLIAGAPVRGHADACLAAIGVDSTAEAVGRHYGARTRGGLLDGWLVAEGDDADIPGVAVGHAPLLMTDPGATAAMVRAARKLVDA
jgi:LPPG:FO 2-phospho-L-lactate transferase